MSFTSTILSFVDEQARQRGLKLSAQQLMQQGLQVRESDVGKLAAGYLSSVIKRSPALSQAYDEHTAILQAATTGSAGDESETESEGELEANTSHIEDQEMKVGVVEPPKAKGYRPPQEIKDDSETESEGNSDPVADADTSEDEEMEQPPEAECNCVCAKCPDHLAMIASLREELTEARAAAAAAQAVPAAAVDLLSKPFALLALPPEPTLEQRMQRTIKELEYHIRVLKKE